MRSTDDEARVACLRIKLRPGKARKLLPSLKLRGTLSVAGLILMEF